MSNTRLCTTVSSPSSIQTNRRKLYLAMLAASQFMVAGQTLASPEGGQVVGGAGSIDQAGSKTTIHQETERMAIDWKSFDVKSDEHVQFIQPSSSSLALNRVLSNKGSEILGRIDANGKVLLVNPNGIVFGKDSQINVGGMIASGLSINPNDFMNGEFTLSAIEGTEGKVINSGIINAATGGSVTLLGKEVKNEGLISAHLGSVNLAAGKAAVVTFDARGMVGVKITQAVLQNDLGLDAAVINSGEINAQGGKILISASVSQDIFSQAVNNGGMNQANSVVVNTDGSYTLGAGANVMNTGSLSTSNTNGDAGQIVLLGDNITSSGTITADVTNSLADANSGSAGHIELNSTDTTELTKTATVSAQAKNAGVGGDIKMLGNKVGLFDSANVDASGANGGGQILIGGDKTGQNKAIRNADFIYLGENSNVKADATLKGDGGKLITFASDAARIYGSLSARGGSEGGNGGFVETSGLKGFEILNAPDVGATMGQGGNWLIDPYDITIKRNSSKVNTNIDGSFTATANTATVDHRLLSEALVDGANITISTSVGVGVPPQSGNITLSSDDLIYNSGSGAATLVLQAANNIIIDGNITRSGGTGKLNISLVADSDKSGAGNISIANGKKIETQGGYFYAGVRRESTEYDVDGKTLLVGKDGFRDVDMTITKGTPKGQDFISWTSTGFGTIDTYGDLGGGDIVINVNGNVKVGALKFAHGVNDSNNAGTVDFNLLQLGSVTINANSVSLEEEVNFNNSGERTRSGISSGSFSGSVEDTFFTINATSNITINKSIYDQYGDARDALNINLTAGSAIDINAAVYTSGGNFTAQASTFESKDNVIDTENAHDGSRKDDNNKAFTQKAADWSNGGNISITAGTSVDLGSIVTDRTAVYHRDAEGAQAAVTKDYQAQVQGNLSIKRVNSADNVKVFQTTSALLNIFGTSTFDLNNSANIVFDNSKVELVNAGNIFNGNVIFTSAGNVNLLDTTAINLGASTVKGSLTLNSGGDIIQSGKLDIAGITTLTATNKNITLADETNKFSTVNVSAPVGALTLKDADALTVGAITTNGSDIDITAGTTLSVNAITTNTASNAGDITLAAANGITLNGDLAANGGADASETGGKIDLKNNVTLGANSLITSTGNTRGDVNFGGTVNGAFNLGLTAKDIIFNGDVGTSGAHLGSLTIASAGDVNSSLIKHDFFTKSLSVTSANNFYANKINTFTAGNNGGIVDVITTGTVKVGAIDTHGDTAKSGGIVNLKGNNIALSGDVNTKDGAALVDSAATLTLVSAGTVDISQFSTGPFTSVLTIVGSAGVDTLKGQDLASSWTIGAANSVDANKFSGIEKITAAATKINTFTLTADGGVTEITGGIAGDTYNLNGNTTLKISGGTGNDIFNIKANTTGNIVGGAGNDTFNILASGLTATSLDGGGDSDTLVGFNQANTWDLTWSGSGAASTEKLNTNFNFKAVENITGGSFVDTFTLAAALAGTRDVKGGASDDIILVPGDATVDFTAAPFTINGVKEAEIIKTNGVAATLSTISANATTVAWAIDDFDGVGTLANNQNDGTVTQGANTVKFVDFINVTGDGGNDTFTLKSNSVITGVVSGGLGANKLDITDATNTNPYIVNVGGTGATLNVTGLNVIDGNVNAASKLIVATGTNTWTLFGGADKGTITSTPANAAFTGTLTFSGFPNITGGTGSDTFDVTAADGSSTGMIDGGTGVNTLKGRAANTDWAITGANAGNVSLAAGATYIKGFTSIQNLIGSGGFADKFTFSDKASIQSADGGVGVGINTADFSAITTDTTITLGGTTFGVTNINRLVGNATKTFTLVATSGTNTWDISDFDLAGTVSDGVNDGKVGAIEFVDFKNLQGGSGADRFNIDTTFAGTISGGGGDDIFNIKTAAGNLLGEAGNDSFVFYDLGTVVTADGQADVNIVDLSNITSDQTITLSGSTIFGVDNAQRVIANAAKIFTLAATAGTSTWTISDFDGVGTVSDGVNDGKVGSIEFVDFKNLQGGSGVDTFNINTAFAGTISGGIEADIFNIKAAAGNLLGEAGNDSFVFFNGGTIVSADGGSNADTVDLSNINSDQNITLNGATIFGVTKAERVIGNASRTFTLTATSGTNIWNISDFDGAEIVSDGVNDGTVAGIEFVNFKSLQGGLGSDTFNIDTAFVGNISGGVGDDTFNIKAAAGNLSGEAGDDDFVFYDAGSIVSGDGGANTNTVDLTNITANRTITLNGTIISGVSNAQRVLANATKTFTLAATSGTNTWDISDFDGVGTVSDGINDGIVAGIQFVDFKNLQGGSGTDIFNIDTAFSGNISDTGGTNTFNINAGAGNLTGGSGGDSFILGASGSALAVDGGLGVNLLTARNANNTWNITSANVGNLAVTLGSVYVTTFSNIQTLNGNSLADIFNIDFAFTGTMNAGAGANVFNVNTAVGALSGGVDNDSFIFGASGSATSVDGGAGSNTIAGRDAANTWNITGVDAGNIGVTSGATYVTNFSNIQTLNGNSQSDIFNLNAAFAGVINAAAGANTFNINTAVGNLTGGIGDDSFIFGASGSATAINGGAGTNSITARNANNTWNITGSKAGNLGVTSGATYLTGFSNIETLNGNSLADIFNIDVAFAGTLNAGAGANIFNINTAVTSLSGGVGDDSFVFAASGSATAIDGGTGTNSITGRNANNTWNITGANAGNLGVTSGATYVTTFNNIQTLNGNSLADIFNIDVAFAGTINAGAGANIFNINTAVGALTGGADDDNFIFGASGSATAVDGGSGTNSITGRDLDNTWNITSANAGNLGVTSGATYATFNNIQTLNGNTQADIFNIDVAFAGVMNAGDGANIFNINTAVGSLSGGVGNDSFVFGASGSAVAIDGGTGTNSIIGRNASNTWSITAADAGSIGVTSGATYLTNFKNIQTLAGNIQADIFNIDAAFAGTIGAGAGANIFNINTAVGSLAGGIGNDSFIFGASGSATAIDGGTGINSITGRNANNTLNITGTNAGNLGVTSAATYLTSFNNIQNLNGNALADTFNIDVDFAGVITAGDGANIFNVKAVTNNLIGGADNDSFIFSGVGSAALVSGGAGNNSLTGRNDLSTWNITGANAGNLGVTSGATYVTNFNNIQNLQGGTLADIFNVNVAVSGTINAGAGANIFNIDAATGNLVGGINDDSFILGGGGSASTIDGGAGTNSLAGRNAHNTWNITAANAGSLGVTSGATYVNNFNNIQSLKGNSLADVFNIDFAFAGTINAGDGLNIFNINSATGSLTGGIGDDSFIFGVNGSATNLDGGVVLTENNILIGRDKASTWNITNTNTGSVSGSSGLYITAFSNIAILKGGTDTDSFIIDTTGSIQTIDGGSGFGLNTLTGRDSGNIWHITTLNTGDVNNVSLFNNIQILQGGVAADNFIFSGTGSVTSLDGGNGGSNTVTGRNEPSTWTIDGAESGSVALLPGTGLIYATFTQIQNLQGGDSDDIFSVGNFAGTVKGGGGLNGFVIDTAAGDLIGGDGNDNFVMGPNGSANSIDGGLGLNTLTGRNTDNTWNINDVDLAELRDVSGIYVKNFKRIQNLQGGLKADTFNINTSFTGDIKGGSGDDIFKVNAAAKNLLGEIGDDSFIIGTAGTAILIDGGTHIIGDKITGRNTVTTWELPLTGNSTLTDTALYASFKNIQILQGGSEANTFNINQVFLGDIFGGAKADTFTINQSAENISGGNGNDIFTINSATKNLFGEAGDDNFTLGAAGSAVLIDGGTHITSGGDKLTGRNTATTWELPAKGNGTLTDTVGYASFVNIQTLQGGSEANIFNINQAFTGTINGGDKADTFNLNALVNGSLLGNAGDDSFIVGTTGSATLIDGGTHNTAGGDTLTGRDTVTSWELPATGNSTLKDTALYASFTNIQTLNGGSEGNIFNIKQVFTGNINGGVKVDIFNIDQAVTGNIIGGNGDDSFIFGALGSASFIDGGLGEDSLTGRNTATTWELAASFNGTLADSAFYASFADIQILNGGSEINIFNINRAFVGNINGGTNNDIFNINQTVTGTLLGGNGDDSFIFGGAGFATLVDGGSHITSSGDKLTGRNTDTTWQLSSTANSTLTDSALYAFFKNIQTLTGGSAIDTLIAANQANSWNISGVDSGSITSVANFSNMENLTGNAAVDTFTFANAGANITGLIDGGTSADASPVIDTLDIQSLTSGVTVELGNNLNANLNVNNIESITAKAGVSNTLIGASNVDQSVGYSWVINAGDTGKISRANNSNVELSTTFANFGFLRGGTNNDAFEANATVTGSIYGGDGLGKDSVDYSNNKNAVEITLGGDGSFGGTGIGGIEGIKGNNDGSAGAAFNSTIGIKDGTNTWTIGAFNGVDGVNDGQITIASKDIFFENFNIINGGTGTDTFNVTDAGKLVGTINGGGSGNIFNASASKLSQIISLAGTATNTTYLTGFSSIAGSTLAASELIGAAAANTWTVNTITSTTKASGTVNGIAFSAFTNLTGSSTNNDVVDLININRDISVGVGSTIAVDLSLKNIDQVKANTTKNNTLLADNTIANTWDINGSNQGKLNSLSFTGFANLTGGALADAFKFSSAAADISGILDSGNGVDTLDLLSAGRAVNVNLLNNTLNNLTVANINVINVETINASSGFVNTLTAGDLLNNWDINAIDSGDLNKSITAAGVTFTHFNNLVGGSLDDTFTFSNTGSVTGYVDGKGHTSGDIVNLSALSNVDILLSSTKEGYRNIEGYIGNNTNSILRADNTDNTWVLGGIQNSGTVNTLTTFSGFTTLYGGSGKDVFDITGDSVSGSINGEGGDDSLAVKIGSGIAGRIQFNGGGDTNSMVVSGGGAGYSAKHTATGNAAGQLGYSNADNVTYNILYSDINTINDNVTAEKLTLNDTQNADVFTFKNNSYSLINSPTIFFDMKKNFEIVATDFNDKVIFDGVINLANANELAIRNATVTAINMGSIKTNSLSLNGTAKVGSSDARLIADIANLSVSAANGDIYLQVPNSVKIAEFSTNGVSGLFDLTLGGDLTSDVKLASNNIFNVVTKGNILLDKDNSLSGNLHLEAGNINLKNSGVTNLKGVIAQDLTVDSGGVINANDGAIVVTGKASFTSGAGTDINLNNVNNNFATLALRSGNDIYVTDLNAITFTEITAARNLVSNSFGANVGKVTAVDVTLNAGGGLATLADMLATSIKVNAQGITTNGKLDSSTILLDGMTGDVTLNGILDTTGRQAVSVLGKSITQNANIVSGDITSLHASEGLIQNADIVSGTDISVVSDGSLTINANKNSTGTKVEYTGAGTVSLLGTITAKSDLNVKGMNINMGANATSNSTSGNISYKGADIAIAALNATSGNVIVNSTGAVTDTNANAVNITAKRLVIDAVTGVGSSDQLETAVTELSLSNSKLGGDIDILNTGNVKIDRLRANGDITLTNLSGNVVLDTASANPFVRTISTNPSDTDALVSLGTSNTNYNIGSLNITLEGGNLTATGDRGDRKNPDITAYNAILNVQGDAGEPTRPLVVYVKHLLSINADGLNWTPYYGFGVKPEIDTSAYKGNIADLIGAGAEQLVQVESLGEINPAVFTGVRNYVYDDIAILMPSDQRYDDKELEE